MVHAQAADAFVGGGRGSDSAVVASGRSPSGAVLVDDREIPGTAGAAGVGSGVGAASGTDDDDVRLGDYFVEAVLAQCEPCFTSLGHTELRWRRSRSFGGHPR